MKKIPFAEYTFVTGDRRSYITEKAPDTDMGETRAFSIIKAKLLKMGEDIKGLKLYSIKVI